MISLVVPTYRERANIAALVERTGAALAATGEEFELIIVDDDSPDGTPDEVRRLQATRPWLKLLVRENERDLSTAVIAGWRIARGDVLGCMDADLQHPPERVPDLLARMRATNTEIVVGSRHVKGGGVSDWSLARRFVSWTATLMATFILPGTLNRVHDPMSGFFLVRRSVLDRAALNPIGYKILLEVLAKGDYTRVEEVPFVFEEREKGGSKMSLKTVFCYLAHLACISLETGEASRIVKYALVGLAGAVINYLATFGLFENLLGLPWAVAVVGGVGLAMLSNFLFNEVFTFWETRRAEPGVSAMLRRLGSFLVLSATGALLNLVLFWLLHGLSGFRQKPSLVVAIAVAGAFNFFVNSNVTWRAWWNRKLLARTLAAGDGAPEFAGENLEPVPCNQCGSTRSTVLYSGDPETHARVTAQTFRCTSEQHGDYTRIVVCGDCGLMYENPRERERDIEQQYEQVEDPTYDRETQGRIYTFSKLMDGLARYTPPQSGRVLDIGCYTGVFLDVARQRGWETWGVEPSAWAARKAGEKGHRVTNAPLRKANLPPEHFDLITIWDVIEHLHDPLGQLKEACRLLKPGGIFGLSTMDVGSLFAKLTGRRWPWFMRMHFYYFTPGSMTRMMKAAGFEVLHIERHKRVVSLRYFIQKAAANLGPLAFLGRLLALPFGKVYVTIDFGDIMNVYARRPLAPVAAETDSVSAAGARN